MVEKQIYTTSYDSIGTLTPVISCGASYMSKSAAKQLEFDKCELAPEPETSTETITETTTKRTTETTTETSAETPAGTDRYPHIFVNRLVRDDVIWTTSDWLAMT